MVLGVPAAIIPEHSQAEPGGGSHLLLLFLMDNLEREGASERERDLEEKKIGGGRAGARIQLPVSLLSSSGNRLLKAAVFVACVNIFRKGENNGKVRPD